MRRLKADADGARAALGLWSRSTTSSTPVGLLAPAGDVANPGAGVAIFGTVALLLAGLVLAGSVAKRALIGHPDRRVLLGILGTALAGWLLDSILLRRHSGDLRHRRLLRASSPTTTSSPDSEARRTPALSRPAALPPPPRILPDGSGFSGNLRAKFAPDARSPRERQDLRVALVGPYRRRLDGDGDVPQSGLVGDPDLRQRRSISAPFYDPRARSGTSATKWNFDTKSALAALRSRAPGSRRRLLAVPIRPRPLQTRVIVGTMDAHLFRVDTRRQLAAPTYARMACSTSDFSQTNAAGAIAAAAADGGRRPMFSAGPAGTGTGSTAPAPSSRSTIAHRRGEMDLPRRAARRYPRPDRHRQCLPPAPLPPAAGTEHRSIDRHLLCIG